ncbi:MAG: 2-oxoglutarate dehydrogenase E1 subunit family protein, partial [Actinomycetota bacterium]
MSSPTNTPPSASGDDFGTNSWLVEEMYERFRDNPAAVGPEWREFFADYVPGSAPSASRAASGAASAAISNVASGNGAAHATKAGGARGVDDTFPMRRPAGITPTQESEAPQPAVLTQPSEPEPIRGVGAAIAANMDRSLAVPT